MKLIKIRIKVKIKIKSKNKIIPKLVTSIFLRNLEYLLLARPGWNPSMPCTKCENQSFILVTQGSPFSVTFLDC